MIVVTTPTLNSLPSDSFTQERNKMLYYIHQWSLGFFYYRQRKLILTDMWISPRTPAKSGDQGKGGAPGSTWFHDVAATTPALALFITWTQLPSRQPLWALNQVSVSPRTVLTEEIFH